MSDMGKSTSSSFFLLIQLPRPSGSFILLPSLLHRPSQAPPPQNLPVKRAIPRTRCGYAANSTFLQVCVCCACAPAHAQHTQTCTPTWGRLRRPHCTRCCPHGSKSPEHSVVSSCI